MPPKAKLSDEEKQKAYDDWCQTDECQSIDTFRQEVLKNKIDNGWADITSDFGPYLALKFKLVADLKVPGRKAKCKLQNLSHYLFL